MSKYKSEEEFPVVLTVEDIEDIMGIGKSSAYDLMKSGEFHIVNVGKQLRVSKKNFTKWLNGEETA